MLANIGLKDNNMSLFAVAGLLFVQAAPITVEAPRPHSEVGFRELKAGDPDGAIAQIAANDSLESDDPAALINRGTAEARLGNIVAARDSYRAALSSRQRYDLELGDGRWLDSRDAARLAMRMLASGRTLALK